MGVHKWDREKRGNREKGTGRREQRVGNRKKQRIGDREWGTVRIGQRGWDIEKEIKIAKNR